MDKFSTSGKFVQERSLPCSLLVSFPGDHASHTLVLRGDFEEAQKVEDDLNNWKYQECDLVYQEIRSINTIKRNSKFFNLHSLQEDGKIYISKSNSVYKSR